MKAFNIKALLVILAFTFSSTATARPTQNVAECESCHNTDIDNVITDPLDLTLGIGDTATITFSIPGAPNNAAIALYGLFDLNPTIDTITGDNWVLRDDTGSQSTLPETPFYTSDIFRNTTTTWDLVFTVGPSAALGDYLIDIRVGVKGGRLDRTESFTVSLVPIPAAVWLFGSGLLGLLAIARRRRNS
jgi:hypothetical protein